MAESNFRGPLNSMGSTEAEYSNSTTPSIEPMDGPSGFYQGNVFVDPRSFPFNKDGTAPARVGGFAAGNSCYLIDTVPQTFSSTVLATNASYTTGQNLTNLALATAGLTNPTPNSQFIAVSVPMLPAGTTVTTTAALAIDYGFTTGTTVTSSTNIQVPDSTQFSVGQWIYVGNAANTNASAGYFTQVTAITTSNFTTITVSVAAGTGMCAPIGQGDLYGSGLLPPATPFGPGVASASRVDVPRTGAGFYRVLNPKEASARGVFLTVTCLASTSGTYSVEVFGWDVWRQPMTELLTMTLNTTSATQIWGKKAFKFIDHAVIQTMVTTSTLSLGISDVLGMPLRVDVSNYLTVQAGNTTVSNNVGFLAAVSTTGSPATNTTGDVRGTVQTSGNGGGTAISTVATTNGSLRFTVLYEVPVWNMINATPLNTVPLIGNAQSTT